MVGTIKASENVCILYLFQHPCDDVACPDRAPASPASQARSGAAQTPARRPTTTPGEPTRAL